MKKIIYLAFFLAIVCGFSGLSLSYVNSITSPIIKEREIELIKESLKVIYPEVEDFEDIYNAENNEIITGIYRAGDKGFIYVGSTMGYKNLITAMVGINIDGTIESVVVTGFDDTPGIGDAILTKEFLDSFVGKSIDNTLDSITGATYSANGLNLIVSTCLKDYQELGGTY